MGGAQTASGSGFPAAQVSGKHPHALGGSARTRQETRTPMRALFTAVVSTVLCVGMAAPAPADTLLAPSAVRKERLNSTQVRITWKDGTIDEGGFQILRRPVTEPLFETRATVGPNVTEYVDDA